MLHSRLQPPESERDRREGERRADLEIGPEAYSHAERARPLDDDEIGDRADEREIAGESRSHGDDQPRPFRIAQLRDEGLQRENRRHIADDVGEHRRDERERRRLIESKGSEACDFTRRQDHLVESGDDDEQSREHQEQRPVDLAIDLLGADPPRQQQEPAGDDRRFGGRNAGEKEPDHRRGDQQRLGGERGVIGPRHRRDWRQLLARQELTRKGERHKEDRQRDAGEGDGPERR